MGEKGLQKVGQPAMNGQAADARAGRWGGGPGAGGGVRRRGGGVVDPRAG